MIRWGSSSILPKRCCRCRRVIFTTTDSASPAALEFRLHSRSLLAAVVGLCVGLPGLSNYGFSAFIAPLTRQFGWSISEVSAWIFFLMVGSCATSLLLGKWVDRFGAGAVILAS